MKLEYTLTLDDYKAAHALHYKQNLGRRINFLIFYRVIPLLAIVLSLTSVGALTQGNKHLFTSLLPVDVGLLWLAIFLPTARFFSLRRCFKQLFPPYRKDHGSHLEITDECIFSGIPGVSEGKIFWPGVFAFAQDKRITLIYTAERRFLFFPTSVLSPGEHTELNDLVARNMVRKQK
jgi:hypothetical protein